jgi:ribosomal-protein-alanine N-acetyltransferase
VVRVGNTFRLRSWLPGDFEALYEIDQLCYEPEIAYSRRELRAYLNYPGAECVIAEAPAARRKTKARAKTKGTPVSKIVGFCVIAVQGGYAYIITIDVLEGWRRKGAGHALLVESEKRAAAGDVREIRLDTATDNASAIAFWEKHGYRKLGVRSRYYPNGRDAFAMIKSLA